MKKLSVMALPVMALCGFSAASQASVQEGWQFELMPYIWAAGINGDITVGNPDTTGKTANFDYSFNDITDNLDTVFMGMSVISYNRFVIYLDDDYLEISPSAHNRFGTKFNADLKMNIGTGAVGYRFDTFGDHGTMDVMVGVRELYVNSEITNTGTAVKDINGTESITDSLVMLRPSVQISEKWRFNPTLSYGIDGDSERTYEMVPQLQYAINDSAAVRFGYKRLHYTERSGTKYNPSYKEVNMDIEGPFLGIGWTFGKSKAVAEETPAPVVAAPVIMDGDKDGVVDGADQCPNTPAGKRVGPMGCDCNFSMTTTFGFDSDVLSEKDKAGLDKLAEVLVNPKLHFITGEVEGYSDNVGEAKYNLELSKKRAAAAAEYLKSKGVSLTDSVQGYGEENPVADNETEEGRAMNRRVVIRRTDCTH